MNIKYYIASSEMIANLLFVLFSTIYNEWFVTRRSRSSPEQCCRRPVLHIRVSMLKHPVLRITPPSHLILCTARPAGTDSESPNATCRLKFRAGIVTPDIPNLLAPVTLAWT
jgi:hypothetical protein